MLNRCILTFGIQSDKTTEITCKLFEGCSEYVDRQIEKLYQQTLAIKKKPDAYLSLMIDGKTFFRTDDCLPKRKVSPFPLVLDKSLEEEGTKLRNFIDQAHKDARFIQMWLTLVLDNDPNKTKKKLPPALAKLTPYCHIDEPYRIPEGKESLWHTAEEKIMFYLGLKLIL